MKYFSFRFGFGVWNRQIRRHRKLISDCQGLREVGWGVTAGKYRVSIWGDGNILELDSGDGCTTLQIY